MERIAKNINILGDFCGKRDIAELTSGQMREAFGIGRADVMVLFGGSVLCGGDVLAEAMKNKIARKYVVVGGAGHTTETLRKKAGERIPGIGAGSLSEAEIFSEYLKRQYNLEPDLLECRSTNCGNNITCLLDVLKDNGVPFESIVLSQDATMQRRMEAGLRKYVGESTTIVNYAVYSVRVIASDSALAYDREILGMWDIDRYISLLMGEIPRLSDDENGYGPCGKGFIAHVDVPGEVREAFAELCSEYPELIRGANPLYASAR